MWVGLAILSYLFFVGRAIQMDRTDVWAYVDGGNRILKGETPYLLRDETPYKYSPPTAFFFIPIGLADRKLGQFMLASMSWLVCILIYWKIHTFIGSVGTLAVLIWSIRFHNYDFSNVQVNHLILFFLLLGLWQKKWGWKQAGSFAVGILFKVSPLLLFLGLFFKRKFNFLLKTSLILVAFVLLPPIVWGLRGLGFWEGFGLYQKWAHILQMTTPYPASLDPIIQSVGSALWSIWPKEEIFSFQIAYYSIFFVLVGTACFRVLQKKVELEPILSALLILTAIFSPLAWKHGYLLCLPAIFYVVKGKCWSLYWASFFLMTFLPTLLNSIVPKLGDYTYTTVLGAILIFGAIVFDYRGLSRSKLSKA